MQIFRKGVAADKKQKVLHDREGEEEERFSNEQNAKENQTAAKPVVFFNKDMYSRRPSYGKPEWLVEWTGRV